MSTFDPEYRACPYCHCELLPPKRPSAFELIICSVCAGIWVRDGGQERLMTRDEKQAIFSGPEFQHLVRPIRKQHDRIVARLWG